MTESLYDQVYREYLDNAKDPAWQLAFQIYLGEVMQEIALYHHGQIQAIVDKAALNQLNVAKNAITKAYLVKKIQEIRKASQTDFKESNWVRDESGRWARYTGTAKPRPTQDATGSPISRGTRAENYHQVVADEINRLPLDSQQQPYRLMGLLAHPSELDVNVSDPDHKADVLQRAAVMTHELENKTRDPRHKQRIQYLVTNPDGFSRIITPAPGVIPQQGKERRDIDWEGGERVQYMTPVGPDNPPTVAGTVMNIGHIAGANPEQASKIGAVAEDIKTTLNSTSWGRKLQSTANVVRVLSDNSPAAVQAHAVAQLVNLIGPEAARAFGPKLRQLTYRYTGQEALPEQYSDVAKKGRTRTPDGLEEPISAYERRLVEDLLPAIPTSSEYAASLQAGSTTPSKGYILDRHGKVVSEAVGYADDWYTPFNLRKLPKLAGGSYVRTRGYGGITTEDLRVAMRTGAKRITVVSNNGVFSMEFEPRALHWGHRFGFGGGMMLRRYAKSLDAIKNGKVNYAADTGPGNQALQLNSRGYLAAMNDLAMKYPYWITKPAESGIAFWQPVKGVREAQGDPEDKRGYVAPLGIRAQGAQAGFAEKDHRELWTDAGTGKYAYDSIGRYQLFEDQKLKVRRIIGETPRAASPPGASTPTVTSSSTASNAGAVQAVRAYQPEKEILTNKQMGDQLAEFRQLVKQGEEHDVTPDMKQYDHLSRFHDIITSNKYAAGDRSEYNKFRDEMAGSTSKRQAFYEEIGDAYLGKIDGTRELLARFASEVNDSDEDEGAKAAAEFYTEKDTPAFDAVRTSPLLSEVYGKVAAAADAGDPKARKIYEEFNFYRNHLRDTERAMRERKAAPVLNDAGVKIFTDINNQVIGILNQERQRQEDPGDNGDDGARTTAKTKAVSINEKDVLDYNLSPREVAMDLLADSAAAYPNDEQGQFEYAQETVAALNNRATAKRKQNLDVHGRRYTEVANALLDIVEESEQARTFRNRIEGQNT